MSKAKMIVSFVNQIQETDYRTKTRKELDYIVECVQNEIELEIKVSHPQEIFDKLTVIKLKALISELVTELYMERMSLNFKAKMISDLLKNK